MKILIALLVCLVFLIGCANNQDNRVDLSKGDYFKEGIGLQICTSSVNSPLLLCKETDTTISTYKMTQEQLDKFLVECNYNIIVIPSTECIGDRLEIIKNETRGK